ncbi:putative transcriptional regulator YdeE [Bacillus tianshenii]|uniref:Transcriptional regulator YdeE n=1 Tax=Sutcliffiella tianshenii TaxID=1463404 RepID=A0ABS2NWV8_9BACI|nr:putative transcriptional regulator YdeE [Bacillus tianshenii]
MNEVVYNENGIKDLGELKLVGFRVLCPADKYIYEIPRATKKLSDRLGEIKHVLYPHLLNGAFVVDASSDEEDGYWIGVEVEEFEDIPSDMVTLTIPSQSYASTTYRGPNYDIKKAYRELHAWMEQQGLERNVAGWHLEVFHEWEDTDNIGVELLDTLH